MTKPYMGVGKKRPGAVELPDGGFTVVPVNEQERLLRAEPDYVPPEAPIDYTDTILPDQEAS